MVMSFDVPRHRHRPIEIYGSEGDDGGARPQLVRRPDRDRHGRRRLARQSITEHAYANGNFRIIGVADMAHAIRNNRPHRASGELAFHVLEVMEAVQRSSDEGRHVTIESRPERPAMLPADLMPGELD